MAPSISKRPGGNLSALCRMVRSRIGIPFPVLSSGLLKTQEWFGWMGGKLLFTVQLAGNSNRYLWVADGMGQAVSLVGEGCQAYGLGFSFPMSLDIVGGKLYIGASQGRNGNELWVSDGTADGTHFVKDIFPGEGSSNPSGAVCVSKSMLFFGADDGTHGRELVADGRHGGGYPAAERPLARPGKRQPLCLHAGGPLFVFLCRLRGRWNGALAFRRHPGGHLSNKGHLSRAHDVPIPIS